MKIYSRVLWIMFGLGCFISIPFILSSNYLLNNGGNWFGRWDFFVKGLILILLVQFVFNWFSKGKK